MTLSDSVREHTRQSRLRLDAVEHLRAEHALITTQSVLRMAESRDLLDRAARRGALAGAATGSRS